MSAYPQASFLTSAYRPDQFVPDEGAEVAFAGRSNAGKSSAINAITERKHLARTSKAPGRTQLINFFELAAERRLVDLPGYGYARVPQALRRHWRQLLEAYFAQRRSLAGLFLIMDARRLLTDFDWLMIDWAGAPRRRIHILLTKADKLSHGAATAALLKTRREIGDAATVQLFSVPKRTGLEEAREMLERFLGHVHGDTS